PYWCAARSQRSTGIDMDTPSRRACSGRTPNPFHLVTGMGEGHLAYAESPFVRTRRRHLRCAFAGYGISRRSRAERAAEGSAAAAAMVPPPLPPPRSPNVAADPSLPESRASRVDDELRRSRVSFLPEFGQEVGIRGHRHAGWADGLG